MMIKYPYNQTGFSLVETLVAITILLIVIIGPLTLVSNSARSTDFANDQVMAFFLAQEGLELAQAARDDLLIPTFDPSYTGTSDTAWDTFVRTTGTYANCFAIDGCGLDQNTNTDGSLVITNCQTDSCQLYFNPVLTERSRYTHDDTGGRASRYTRVITMDESPAGQVEVVSRVTWRSDGQRAEQEVAAITYLFNVYGR